MTRAKKFWNFKENKLRVKIILVGKTKLERFERAGDTEQLIQDFQIASYILLDKTKAILHNNFTSNDNFTMINYRKRGNNDDIRISFCIKNANSSVKVLGSLKRRQILGQG